MKKLLTLILAMMTLIALALPASAFDSEYDHQHNWDVINWGDETEMFCACGVTVTTPHDSLFCCHEMVDVQTSRTHGTECIYCGFTVRKEHSWEFDDEYSDDGDFYHYAWCVECGFEADHRLVSYHNDTEHILVCTRCDVTIHHELKYEHRNRYCHEVFCDYCDYVFYEAHNLNEDGICVECELYTGMLVWYSTTFDIDGSVIENEYCVLIDGEEWCFYVDECYPEVECGDVFTFVSSDGWIDEIVEVFSADDFDEDEIFFIETEEDVEWLWWNDFHAVNYVAYYGESTFNLGLGDGIVIIEPANPLQDTIYYIVN